MQISFDDIVLDGTTRRAAHRGRDLDLSPRVFATLWALASRADEVVTLDALMEAVWPGVHVERNNISQAVAAVRKALEPAGAARRLRTVPRAGYCFAGPVRVASRDGSARNGMRLRAALVAAAALMLIVDGGVTARPGARTPTPAHRAAREALESRETAGMQRARALFAGLVARDGADAGAWTGLAEAHYLLGFYGIGDAGEAARLAGSAASRAIALDAAASRAYAVRASVALDGEWDLPASARDFSRALTLDPADPLAQHWSAWWLLAAGRVPEARAAIDRAVRLQPFSAAALMARATFAYLDGDYRAAIDDSVRVLDLDPSFSRAHLRLGLARMAMGQREAALVSLERAYVLDPSMPEVAGALAHARAISGDRPGALQLRDAHAASLGSYEDAIVLTGLGRRAEALASLFRARAERRLTPGLYAAEPRLAPLRGLPSFTQLAGRDDDGARMRTLFPPPAPGH